MTDHNDRYLSEAVQREQHEELHGGTDRGKQFFGIGALEFGQIQSRKRIFYLKNILETAGTIPTNVVLELCLKVLPNPARNRVRRHLIGLQKAKKLPKLIPVKNNQPSGFDELYTPLFNNEKAKTILYRLIIRELETLYKGHQSLPTDDDLETRLDKVCSLFDIDAVGKEIILFFYLRRIDATIDKLTDNLCEYLHILIGYYPIPWVRPLSCLTGLPQNEIANALSNTSPLLRAGLLESNRDIAGEVSKYLEGYGNRSLFAGYYAEYLGESIPLESHTLDMVHRNVIKNLISHKPESRGINILLYGIPGTGKTEFCRSLGKFMKMPVYEITNIHEKAEIGENRVMFRYRALLACQRSTNPQQSIIVVDEADAMLNTDGFQASGFIESEKGQINRMMDDSRSIIFWITNRYDEIDASTRRRFDYSVHFEALNCTQRRRIWTTALEKYGLSGFFSDEEVELFAEEFEINAGGIDVAIRQTAGMNNDGTNKEEILQTSRELLKAHRKIMVGSECFYDEKEANAPLYRLEGLNIKADIASTLSLIESFNRCWHESKGAMAVRNLNMLLYGPPGTGKTEFAKFVARTTKRRLLVRRASDLLNAYLGETEKSIREAFRQAEREQAILFIDEADSLFGSRDNAVRSWEISQVNEMLSNMEEFKGMLICATNFKEFLDSAAIRRFTIKLEFDYLGPDGNMEFYRRYLAPLIADSPADPEIKEIRSISALTPGDFKIVYQQNAFFEKSEISHQRLIQALKHEVLEKNEKSSRRMGF